MELKVWQESQPANEVELLCCGYGTYEYSLELVDEAPSEINLINESDED